MQDCFATACQDYQSCIESADDPCNAPDCTPTGDCQTCITNQGTCVSDTCFDLIMCSATTPGGACDQIDDCCASLDEANASVCQMTADVAKSGGDMVCESLIMSFCPTT